MMAVTHFFHNVTNNPHNSTGSLIMGTYSVGFTKPTVTSKPTHKTLLAQLVLCWLPLANILKPLGMEFKVCLLAVGSFLADSFFGGYHEG